MKFGAVEYPGLKPDRNGHWETFDAFCLGEDIARRDRAVLGFINMCVLLWLMHQAMEKTSYAKLPGWIEELEGSKAFDSIVDLEDAPFDHFYDNA